MSAEALRAGSAAKIVTALAATMGWFVLSESGSFTLGCAHELTLPTVGAILGRGMMLWPGGGLRDQFIKQSLTQISGIGLAAYLTAYDSETMNYAYRYLSGDESYAVSYFGDYAPAGLMGTVAALYGVGLFAPTAAQWAGNEFRSFVEKQNTPRTT